MNTLRTSESQELWKHFKLWKSSSRQFYKSLESRLGVNSNQPNSLANDNIEINEFTIQSSRSARKCKKRLTVKIKIFSAIEPFPLALFQIYHFLFSTFAQNPLIFFFYAVLYICVPWKCNVKKGKKLRIRTHLCLKTDMHISYNIK